MKEIGKALLKFHASVGKIVKDAKNPHFKSRYASLPAILNAIRDPLQDAGLVIFQTVEGDDRLRTVLLHPESGEAITSDPVQMVIAKRDPQGVGSSITYYRRYSIGAILGLIIDDDDDGNIASRQPRQQAQPQPQAKKSGPKLISPDGEVLGEFDRSAGGFISWAQSLGNLADNHQDDAGKLLDIGEHRRVFALMDRDGVDDEMRKAIGDVHAKLTDLASK